jgi:hypothetical protein
MVPQLPKRHDDYAALRRVYQGKVDEQCVDENIKRFKEDHALTAALNWYRALDIATRFGKVKVLTLYVWASADQALGEVAALDSANYADDRYGFEVLEARSHWVLDEVPDTVSRDDLGASEINVNATVVPLHKQRFGC